MVLNALLVSGHQPSDELATVKVLVMEPKCPKNLTRFLFFSVRIII